jgi:TRAP-type mannitol/chloroaromatic compound transport system permease small subunit
MRAFFHFIDEANRKIGDIVCFLILIIMLAVGTSTITRYFFNEPLTIVWPFIRQIFGIIILLGAAYTLLHHRHIRVEILYDHLPAWLRTVSRVMTLICFLAFLGALTWQGIVMARISLMLKETTAMISWIPIYPFKILLPIAACLFLLQGIAYYFCKEKPSEETQTAERRVTDTPKQSEN